MRRRVVWAWVLLIALFSLWQVAESAWESSGILVLDISRSMQENDPHNIRSDGEQTFIDLLSSVEGNALGIVFFGAKARVMKPLTTIQRQRVKSFKDSLPPIDSRAQRTEIGLGLAKGMEMLAGRGGTRYLIVMSDGELDRSGHAGSHWTSDDEAALRELRALYPKLRRENILVFTIALADYSRQAFGGTAARPSNEPVPTTAGDRLLQEIAESTNGKFYRVARQRDYLNAFLDIFLHIRPPTLYTLARRELDEKFALSQFDAEAIIIGPRDMVLVAPTGQRYGLGLPSSARSPWVHVFPYQHWSLIVISRPLGDTSGYEGTYQIVDQGGNPVRDTKVLVHSAIALSWEHPLKHEYAQREMLPIGVDVHASEGRTLQEDGELAEFLKGAEVVASLWPPHVSLPVSKPLTRRREPGRFVFTGDFEDTAVEGDYRLEVELLSTQHPSLNRKIDAAFKVGPPYFRFAVVRHGPGQDVRLLDSTDGQAHVPIFAGDRVELLAELAGGVTVNFRREPAIRVDLQRAGQPWKVFSLERVQQNRAVRYHSPLFPLPTAGEYTLTFRAVGNAVAEVWDDHLLSTRSLPIQPVQIVFPARLTVSPVPWTATRILTYVSLGGVALGLAISAGMAVLARFVRTPLRGWLLSAGQGAPQLFVLSSNPRALSWRWIFPKRRATIGTAPHCDHQLDLRDTGVEVEAEVYVGPWWRRSGGLYIWSERSPSHVYVDGVEVLAKQDVLLMDGEAPEKSVYIRFGNYEMTFDA